MKYPVYRNLDRPFTLFGIKGRYIGIAGAMFLGILVVAFVAGSLSNTFIGLAAALILLVTGYLLLLEVQQRFPEKALGRKLSSLNLPQFILIRSKIWKR